MDTKRSHQKVVKYYEQITNDMRINKLNHSEVIEYVNKFNFSLTTNPHDILHNIEKPILRKKGFELIIFEEKYYLHIITPAFRVLLQDNTNQIEKRYLTSIVFCLIFLLFVFIYVLILKNIKNTNLLLNSRQLFLRTVMHELKTPIAKGRIVSELLDNKKQKKRMITIFEKLEFLINDFAKVEEIVSKQYHLNKSNYSIDTILKYSIDMLMLDSVKDNITLECDSSEKISVDLELFSMAIKNLLDNALKYSSNKKVQVEYKDNQLKIISNGDKLTKPLSDYYKPFHNDTKSKNHGMGLGLYIVHSILTMHNKKLIYNYQQNKNIFSINL